jgi:hypothetical protein
MKTEDFKNMVREIIREELSSIVQEQAAQWWLTPAEAEVGGHLEPSLVHEDEYDRKRDAKLDKNPMHGIARNRFSNRDTGKDKLLAQKVKYKTADGKEGEATVQTLLGYDKDHPGRKAAARIYAQFMGKRKAADADSKNWYAQKDAENQAEREKNLSPRELERLKQISAAKKAGKTSEQICEDEGCLDEKSVPQPYDRKSARKMSKSQIEKRRKIGRDMMSNEKTASKFRKKYGDEWKDYLWAAASSAAFRQSGSTKSDDKRKK